MLHTVTPLFVALLIAPINADRAKPKDAGDGPKIVGSWKITSGERAGDKVGKERLQAKITITKETITIEGDGQKFVMGYKINGKASPAAIDMEIKEGNGEGTKAVGVIAADGDGFKLCYVVAEDKDTKRPTKFESTKDNNAFFFLLKPAEKK